MNFRRCGGTGVQHDSGIFLRNLCDQLRGSSPARVTEVADGSPEAEAGLEAGDIITSYEGRHISIGKELNSVMTVQGVPTDEITLEVKKADGEKKTITYEPTVTTRGI